MRRFWGVVRPEDEPIENLIAYFNTLPQDSASYKEHGDYEVPISDVINAVTADLLRSLIMGLGKKRFSDKDSLLAKLRKGEKITEDELEEIIEAGKESAAYFAEFQKILMETKLREQGEINA